jgi:hypothetical protein
VGMIQVRGCGDQVAQRLQRPMPAGNCAFINPSAAKSADSSLSRILYLRVAASVTTQILSKSIRVSDYHILHPK